MTVAVKVSLKRLIAPKKVAEIPHMEVDKEFDPSIFRKHNYFAIECDRTHRYLHVAAEAVPALFF